MSRSSNSRPQNPASKPTARPAGAGRVPSNQAPSGAGAGGPLGNKRKNVDALRRERWADQRQAASIYRRKADAAGVDMREMKGRGVTLCGWTQIASQGGSRLMLVDPGDDQGARAFWAGLQRCGGVWNCPVCTQAKAEAARISLNLGLAAARRLGLSPVMMTLTARHSRDMSLRDFWDALGAAEQELKRSRAWKRLTGKATKTRPAGPMRRGGFAKAIEVTQSNRSGWHPHAHIICLLDLSEDRAIAAIEELRDEWLHQLNRVGLDGTSAAARRHAFDVQGAAQAGNYVAKWGAAEEMSGGAKKEGRKGGRSMWQLLRDARTADTARARQQAEDLWHEAVSVMAGVHQLRMNPAFRALVEDERERTSSDEELPEAVEVWRCGLVRHDPTWEHVRWKRVRAMEAAEQAGLAGAHDAVLDVVTSPAIDADDMREEVEDIDLIDDDDDWSETCGQRQQDASPAHTSHVTEQEVTHGDGRGDEEAPPAATLEGGGMGRASGEDRGRSSRSGECVLRDTAATIAADRSAPAGFARPDRC